MGLIPFLSPISIVYRLIMSDQVKANLDYNYCLLETAVENITDDYFNAITPILTDAISKGFDRLKEENPQNRRFLDKLKMKSIRMAYNKGTKIVDEAEEDLKSLFSMDGQLFKNDECQEKFKNTSNEDENEIDQKLTQILARIRAKEELSRKLSAGIKEMDNHQQKLDALQE